jgi:hypothetical protein
MSTTPRLKPPHDFFPWIYWGLFAILVPLAAIYMALKPVPPRSQVNLPVFYHKILAYQIIRPNDIIIKRVDESGLKNDIITNLHDLIGHYALSLIVANEPIHSNQIGIAPDPSLISNTFAVAIPANNSTILGGNIQAGDVVILAIVPLSNNGPPHSIVFQRVLVLDVKANGNQSIIILAIPANRWLEFLAQTHNATIELTKPIQ